MMCLANLHNIWSWVSAVLKNGFFFSANEHFYWWVHSLERDVPCVEDNLLWTLSQDRGLSLSYTRKKKERKGQRQRGVWSGKFFLQLILKFLGAGLCLCVCVPSKQYIMRAVLTVCSQASFSIPFLRNLWNKIQPSTTEKTPRVAAIQRNARMNTELL